MKRKNIDLTEGVIWKSLLIFFLPILGGSLLQQLYITADAVIIGNFVGKQGLAAIDSVYSLIKLPLNFLTGLSGGATIIISQYFGAKNREQLSQAAHTAVAFAFAGGLALSVLGVIFAPALLRIMDVPADIFASALAYVRIIFAGLSASMVYNIGAGMLRAVGDSRTPFIYLLACNTINVALDGVFVIALGWGVAGTALSTVLAQVASAVLIVRLLTKTPLECRLELQRVRFHRPALAAIFALGLPIGLQSTLFPIANMVVQTSINATGTDNIAAWALCGKLDFLIWLAADSLGAAISTFSAQNYGARLYKRLHNGVMVGTALTLAIVAAISGALFLWSEPLSRIFISDAAVIARTREIVLFLAPLYFLYVFGETLSGAIRGTGETVKPMILTLLCTCCLRVAWILLVVPQRAGLMPILAAYPLSWAAAAAGFIIYYLRRVKKPVRE